jgi:hypothetical protein
MQQILNIDPATYQRHNIHVQERDWAETNCYVDVWIELLHALGHEPIAAMSFTLGIDFEGDQWTFFKFKLADIYRLYNIDVQELAIWKPLTVHIEEQVGWGRPVLVELDSMYLPDTVGTAYKEAHVKTTVSVNLMDIENKKMGYFHAQSYYQLEGQDFIDVFRLENKDASHLEPYVEIAKLTAEKNVTNDELVKTSIIVLKEQLRALPKVNPFLPFKVQLEKDIAWLKEEGLEMFHHYCFATLRQFGACFEQASFYIDWLIQNGEQGLEEARQHYKDISELTKVYQFQLARVVSRGKTIDLTTIDTLSEHWDKAVSILKNKYLD